MVQPGTVGWTTLENGWYNNGLRHTRGPHKTRKLNFRF